jgi:hypothetical protein
MKKLYFLNEEEKSRILKLHKSRQVGKFWLNEQDGSLGTNIGTGGSIDIEALQASYSAKLNNVNNSLRNYCANKKRSIDQGALTTFKNATKGSGWMSYDTYGGVKSYLQNLSPNDFCATYNEYNRTTGANLYEKFNEYIMSSESETEIANIIIAKFNGDANGLNFKGSKSIDDNELEDNELEDDELEDDENGDNTIPGPKERGKLVPGPKDPTWMKKKLRIERKFPCFKGKPIEMTESANVFSITNPSAVPGIVETNMKSGGRDQTKITTGIELNVSTLTYLTEKDYSAGKSMTGKFACSSNGRFIELTPTEEVGESGGIIARFPCLRLFNAIQDPVNKLEAIMSDGARLKHPQFSGYPAGDITFYYDGTFLTQDDDDRELDSSGTFECRGRRNNKNKLRATTYHGADYSTIPVTPTPPKTDDQTKKTDDQTKKTDDNTNKVTPKPVIGMGSVMSSVQFEIPEILKCANIPGMVLHQGALNQLYQFIKNNKK